MGGIQHGRPKGRPYQPIRIQDPLDTPFVSFAPLLLANPLARARTRSVIFCERGSRFQTAAERLRLRISLRSVFSVVQFFRFNQNDTLPLRGLFDKLAKIRYCIVDIEAIFEAPFSEPSNQRLFKRKDQRIEQNRISMQQTEVSYNN